MYNFIASKHGKITQTCLQLQLKFSVLFYSILYVCNKKDIDLFLDMNRKGVKKNTKDLNCTGFKQDVPGISL